MAKDCQEKKCFVVTCVMTWLLIINEAFLWCTLRHLSKIPLKRMADQTYKRIPRQGNFNVIWITNLCQAHIPNFVLCSRSKHGLFRPENNTALSPRRSIIYNLWFGMNKCEVNSHKKLRLGVAVGEEKTEIVLKIHFAFRIFNGRINILSVVLSA